MQNTKKLLKDYASIVTSTMGPAGAKVIFKSDTEINGVKYQSGTATRDGYTVVGLLQQRNNDTASNILLDACKSVVDQVGDGTTHCALFLSILIDGDTSIKSDCEKAVKMIDELKVTPTKEQLINVAISSANNDQVLGTMIGELLWTLGKDAFVQAIYGTETRAEIRKGFSLTGGCTPLFYPGKSTLSLEEPNILILEDNIESHPQITPIVNLQRKLNPDCFQGEKQTALPKRLRIIGSLIVNQALGTFINNPNLNIFVCMAPKDDRVEVLNDLGAMTGAKAYFGANLKRDNNKNVKLELTDVGQAERAVLAPGYVHFTFKEGVAREDMPAERKAQFTKGVGVITIGGKSNAEMEAIKFRIEDSVQGTLSAFDGVIPGGGTTTSKISNQFSGAFCQALAAPYAKIRENGTFEETEVWDSANVIKAALTTATSVALEIIQSKYVI